MNVSYNSALRQSKAIRADLERINSNYNASGQPAAPTPSEIGNVSASLASFSKTIDDYNQLARQELVQKKQEEAYERIKRFREDLSQFRAQVEELKKAREDAAHVSNRSELLGRRPYVTATPENPYSNSSMRATQAPTSGYGAGPSAGFGSQDEMREAHVMREQNFFQNTHSALDETIQRAQLVLGDLGQQKDMLKNTQKRLYSVANTLGISGDTIRMVERRAREDKWIFGVGVVVFFLFCWACLHFLR